MKKQLDISYPVTRHETIAVAALIPVFFKSVERTYSHDGVVSIHTRCGVILEDRAIEVMTWGDEEVFRLCIHEHGVWDLTYAFNNQVEPEVALDYFNGLGWKFTETLNTIREAKAFTDKPTPCPDCN